MSVGRGWDGEHVLEFGFDVLNECVDFAAEHDVVDVSFLDVQEACFGLLEIEDDIFSELDVVLAV